MARLQTEDMGVAREFLAGGIGSDKTYTPKEFDVYVMPDGTVARATGAAPPEWDSRGYFR